MSEFEDLLRDELAAAAERGFARVELSSEQRASLLAHYELLMRWNSRMNLTAIRTVGEAVRLHYGECLIFGAWMKAVTGDRVVDVGSGAGFPGMVLSVLRPDCEFTVMDSHQRKGVFLREAARGRTNVRVMVSRGDSAEGTWDWLVSRAVRMDEVLELVPRLASRVGLLVGEEDSKVLLAERKIEWDEPLRLPWGERRYALFGVARRST